MQLQISNKTSLISEWNRLLLNEIDKAQQMALWNEPDNLGMDMSIFKWNNQKWNETKVHGKSPLGGVSVGMSRGHSMADFIRAVSKFTCQIDLLLKQYG